MLFMYTSYIFKKKIPDIIGLQYFHVLKFMSLSLNQSFLNLFVLNIISTLSAEFLKIWEPSGGQQLHFS